MAYIERAISYVLKTRVKSSKCTLVVGARQVGKSTLIQHEFSEYHCTTFDDQLIRLQAREEPKLFFLNNPCPLIIDEVLKESSVLEEIKQIVDCSQKRMLNYANIASEIGVSEPTVKNWISILERTGIVYILQPYSASALNRAIKTPKIYFRDTGLACYLTKWLTEEV